MLNLSDTSMATRSLDDDEKLVQTLFVSGQNRQVTMINESGLFSLVLRSNKPEAKTFKKWVTAEVLPSIRKHGGFLTEVTTEALISNPDLLIELATNLKTERKKRKQAETQAQLSAERVALQEKVIREVKPKVDYYHEVLSAEDSILTNIIAKELNMSAMTLNRRLKLEKVIYKQGDTWVLYSRYHDKGYAKTRTYTYVGSNGETRTNIQLVWTQSGREFIHNLVKSGLK